MRREGWVPLRRGLQEHMDDGRLSDDEALLYLRILWNADPSSGILHSSAEELAEMRKIPVRTCRYQLACLEKKGYIKRLNVQGRNGDYPILVHRYLCTADDSCRDSCREFVVKGMRLNAAKSTSLRNLVYDDSPKVAAKVAAHLLDKLKEEDKSRVRAGLPPSHRPSSKPQRPFDPGTFATPLTSEAEAKVVEYFEQQQAKKKASGRGYPRDSSPLSRATRDKDNTHSQLTAPRKVATDATNRPQEDPLP